VRDIEGIGNFERDRNQLIELQRPAGDAVLERNAFEQLHHDKGAAIVLADLVNRANVGMVQGRGSPCLTAKALQSDGALRQIVRQKLERHVAAEAQVFRFVHHTHSPATQALENAVMRDGLADHFLCRSCFLK